MFRPRMFRIRYSSMLIEKSSFVYYDQKNCFYVSNSKKKEENRRLIPRIY